MIRMIQKSHDQFTSHHRYRCSTASVNKSMSDKMISALSDFYLTLRTDCDKTVPLWRLTPAELPACTTKRPWPTCSSGTQSPRRFPSITAAPILRCSSFCFFLHLLILFLHLSVFTLFLFFLISHWHQFGFYLQPWCWRIILNEHRLVQRYKHSGLMVSPRAFILALN